MYAEMFLMIEIKQNKKRCNNTYLSMLVGSQALRPPQIPVPVRTRRAYSMISGVHVIQTSLRVRRVLKPKHLRRWPAGRMLLVLLVLVLKLLKLLVLVLMRRRVEVIAPKRPDNGGRASGNR